MAYRCQRTINRQDLPTLETFDISGFKNNGRMINMRDNNKWSKKVTENSNALDLENGVFSLQDPKKIAESLKRSAEQSERRKGTPYQSAMSMLNFYINRAGKNLTEERKKTLELSKIQLKVLFNKTKIEKNP